MEVKKTAYIAASGLVVGFLVGYGLGRVSTGTPVNPILTSSGSYQQGYDAAKRKLAASGLIPEAADEIRTISGTITAIEGSTIVLKTDLRSANPLEEAGAPVERHVTVGPLTRIVRASEKTPEEFGREITAFDEALAKLGPNDSPPLPPASMNETPITLADLKPNDLVSVVADHDVFSEAAFTATLVTLTATSTAP